MCHYANYGNDAAVMATNGVTIGVTARARE